MAIRIRGGQARQDLYWNRLESGLLCYDEATARDQYQSNAQGAVDLQAAIFAADNGRGRLELTVAAAELLAFLVFHWQDYFQDAGWDGQGRGRAALCGRILNELRLQGIQYRG